MPLKFYEALKLLRRESRRGAGSLKKGLDYFLRLGPTVSEKPAAEPLVVHPRRFRAPSVFNYDSVGELLERLEGPFHR